MQVYVVQVVTFAKEVQDFYPYTRADSVWLNEADAITRAKQFSNAYVDVVTWEEICL